MNCLKMFLSVIAALAAMTGCSQVVQNNDSEASANVSELNEGIEVHFIDVGQADSALVMCGGESMLIDGGNAADSDIIYTYLKKYEISELDYIVASHAHEDHVGGLSGALNYASAKNALCPVKYYDSRAFKNFVKYLADSKNGGGIEITVPLPGDSFTLGGAQVDILGCNGAEGTNNSSIILKITYDDVSFLFTGDAEREAEQAVLDAYADSEYDLSADVLKVGHHGSDTSTTYPFLREIMPEYAVISVGKDNSYGHPSDDTLSRLYDAGAQVYRTDLCGDIIFRSDGKEITVETAKNISSDISETENTVKAVDIEKENENKGSNGQSANSGENAETYILNTSTKKYHREHCSSVDQIKEKNRQIFNGSAQELEKAGYSPCKNCNADGKEEEET